MGITEKNKSTTNEKESFLINHIPIYSCIDVKNIRATMHMTQKQFSEAFGVSIKTVEAWENGRNRPNGVAMRLLEMCDKKPDLFMNLDIIKKI